MNAKIAAALIIVTVIAAAAGYLAAINTVQPKTYTVTRTYTTIATKTFTVTSTAPVTLTRATTSTVTETIVKMKTWPRFIIDALGRNVTIPKPPKKIATLSPAATEILWALGELNKLVACDHYSDYPPIVMKWKREGRVVDIGGYWWSSIKLEKLVAVHPDLVIAEVGAHAKLEKAFEKYGLRVLYILGGAAKSLSDVYHDIWLVGYATGAEANATRWITSMRLNITLVEEKLAKANATRVPTLFIVWWSPQGVYVAGGDTFISDMIVKAGGVNVASRYTGWPRLSLEQVAVMKPALILYANAYVNRTRILKTLREIASASPFKHLVENGARVCGVYGSLASVLLRPGPRAAMGVELLAKILHPGLFGKPPESPSTGVVCLTGR